MNAVLAPDHVRISVPATDQHDALRAIAELGVALGRASEIGPLVEGMSQREAQGTTGLMDGIAIPHVKSPAVDSATVLVVRLNEPVTWPTLDGSDVSLLLALLIPEAESGTTHLALLSKLARTLVKADARRELLQTDTAETLYQAVARHLPA